MSADITNPDFARTLAKNKAEIEKELAGREYSEERIREEAPGAAVVRTMKELRGNDEKTA